MKLSAELTEPEVLHNLLSCFDKLDKIWFLKFSPTQLQVIAYVTSKAGLHTISVFGNVETVSI